MKRYILDFETACDLPLKEVGAAAYVQSVNFEVLCLVWRLEGARNFGAWAPLLPEHSSLDELRALALDPDVTFVSHAAFEQLVWMFYMVPVLGMPPLPPERWQDTQATAAWYSRPLSLEPLMSQLSIGMRKDMEGSALTIGLSKPMTKAEWMRSHDPSVMTAADHGRLFVPGTLDRRPSTLRRVVEYCKRDVACEEEALKVLGDLSRHERPVWLLDQEINQRGIRLDLDFIRAAQSVVQQTSGVLQQEFADLTGGLKAGQVEKVIAWCGTQGLDLANLQKGTIAALIGESEDDAGYDGGYESLAEDELPEVADPGGLRSGALPGNVLRVLQVRQMLGSASVKKLERMLACVCSDGRARYLVQYHAAHPGRWGGRLLQPQNFPRGGLVDSLGHEVPVDDVVAAIMSRDPEWCRGFYKRGLVPGEVIPIEPIEVIAFSLRYALIPDPGKAFEVGDYAGIEMRVDLAVAGQHDKCELLASGKDVYIDMADQIYGLQPGTVTKADVEKRTIGKNTVLGCGFQMGGPRFNERYCPHMPLSFAESVVKTYREDWAPRVPELWKALKDACFDCVKHGKTVTVYGCTFRRQGEYMALDLPSGWQTIWFPHPHMHTKAGWSYPSPHYWAMKNGRMIRVGIFGGYLCENICQALARGLLVEAMGRLNYREQRPIVLTVHDEIVSEVDEGRADLALFKRVMEERPAWAERIGIPIEVETPKTPLTRYKK